MTTKPTDTDPVTLEEMMQAISRGNIALNDAAVAISDLVKILKRNKLTPSPKLGHKLAVALQAAAICATDNQRLLIRCVKHGEAK